MWNLWFPHLLPVAFSVGTPSPPIYCPVLFSRFEYSKLVSIAHMFDLHSSGHYSGHWNLWTETPIDIHIKITHATKGIDSYKDSQYLSNEVKTGNCQHNSVLEFKMNEDFKKISWFEQPKAIWEMWTFPKHIGSVGGYVQIMTIWFL